MSQKYTLDLTKSEIIQLMVKVLFWFCLPLALYSWSRYFRVGFLPVMVLHGFLLLVLFIVFLKRKELSQNVQAHTIVLIFLGIAFGGIPTRAQIIYGIPGGIFATAFATFLFNRKVASRYLVFQVAMVLLLGLVFGQPEKRFQSIFELVSYTVFQFFLILSLDKVRLHLNDMIEELNEAVKAKGRFLAMMSHEIRTPLNGISIAAENLREDQEEKGSHEMAEVIFNSTHVLKGIINDILDYSKMENGKISINKEPFDFLDFLKRVENEFKIQAEYGEVKLIFKNETEVEIFNTDSFRLEQILRNLLSNAFKFTSEGTINVTASKTDNDELLLVVRDTGIGIAADKVDKIFEEFEQENAGISRVYGGTGLGLSIVKGLSEALGGRIDLSSVYGEGSTFKVYLPYDAKERKDERPVVEKSSKPQCQAEVKSRILIVEDNDINIKVFIKRLSNLGLENVLIAKNGEAALKLLSNEKVDIIFMDIQMPIMDGLEATKAIRNGDAGENAKVTPIVGLSANSFDEDILAAKEAGMDDYIGKPLSRRSLIDVLNKYLT